MKRISQQLLARELVQGRKDRNLTQGDLSDKTGINRVTIGRIENGEYIPSIVQLEKIEDVLGFGYDDICEDDEPTFYRSFRGNPTDEDDKRGIDRLFDMMMVAKQQIMLRKAENNEA